MTNILFGWAQWKFPLRFCLQLLRSAGCRKLLISVFEENIRQSKKWLKWVDDKDAFRLLLFGILFGTIAPVLSQPNPDWTNVLVACFSAFSIIGLFLKGRRDSEEKDERITRLESDNKEKDRRITKIELDSKEKKKRICQLESKLTELETKFNKTQ